MAQPLDDASYRERSADWARVKVPFLSAASWGGFGLHSRGNFEAFTRAASDRKWLEVHPGRHEEWFYLPYGMALQRRFFDHFLKGLDNGWQHQPPVQLNIRRALRAEFEVRSEHEWPLARTRWTELYLDADAARLDWDPPAAAARMSLRGMGGPTTLYSAPLAEPTEITGPLAATVYLSSSTTDADLFVTLRAFGPDGQEVDFQGTLDPRAPLAQGCLRASQRKLDPARSTPFQPYHPHDEVAADARPDLPPADRDLAHLRRAARRGSPRCDDRGRRLRPSDADGRPARLRRIRPVPAHRPGGPAAGGMDGMTTIHTGPDTPTRLLLPIIPAGG